MNLAILRIWAAGVLLSASTAFGFEVTDSDQYARGEMERTKFRQAWAQKWLAGEAWKCFSTEYEVFEFQRYMLPKIWRTLDDLNAMYLARARETTATFESLEAEFGDPEYRSLTHWTQRNRWFDPNQRVRKAALVRCKQMRENLKGIVQNEWFIPEWEYFREFFLPKTQKATGTPTTLENLPAFPAGFGKRAAGRTAEVIGFLSRLPEEFAGRAITVQGMLVGDDVKWEAFRLNANDRIAQGRRIVTTVGEWAADPRGTILQIGLNAGLYLSSAENWGALTFDALTFVATGRAVGWAWKRIPAALWTTEKEREVAVALERALQENRKLREATELDALTRIPNGRSILEGGQVLKRATEALADGRKHCFIYIDARKLKWINDLGGHPMGDDYLVELARTIGQTVRKEDIVVRLAGDQFGVVAYGADRVTGQIIAAKIEQAVAGMPFRQNYMLPTLSRRMAGLSPQKLQEISRTTGPIPPVEIAGTVATGVAESRQGDTLLQLIGRADEALQSARTPVVSR